MSILTVYSTEGAESVYNKDDHQPKRLDRGFVMNSRDLRFCLFLLFIVLPGAARSDSAAKKSEASPPSDAPIILKLEQRDRRVTVRSSLRGPLYTVETKQGEVLVRDTQVDELKASNPKLYDTVKDAIAGASGLIDASVN